MAYLGLLPAPVAGLSLYGILWLLSHRHFRAAPEVALPRRPAVGGAWGMHREVGFWFLLNRLGLLAPLKRVPLRDE